VKRRDRKRADVVFLHDLVPRSDVKGGSGRRIFGAKVEEVSGSATLNRGKSRGTSRKERKDGQG
jgi:hypothetical protein